MFNWMNRRLYFFLKFWFAFLAVTVLVVAVIAAIIMLMAWADQQWGTKGWLGALGTLIIIMLNSGLAWAWSETAVDKELEKQRKIERSLKRDW